MKGRVLIVDDEKNVGFVITAMLEKAGFEVLCFQESRLAMDAIENEELDAVVTDLYMPGPGGMEVLEFVKSSQPQLPVVMITAFGTIESAVSALKQGAFDFITKPFEQADLIAIVSKAVATHRERQKEPIPLFRGNSPALVPLAGSVDTDSILAGESDSVHALRDAIAKASMTDAPVLILGEIGSGKEVVEHEIHRLSKRSDRPLIRVNCGVVPQQLLSSEIFGEGARPGRIELAQDGVLVLEEVTEMSQETQTRLLQVLRQKTFERVGAVAPMEARVRVIATSARDLESESREGRFNLELFYELNVFPIRIPALRERAKDIPDLVRSALVRVARKYQKPISRIEPDCLLALERFSWPGNLRQLENVMERMILVAESDTLRAEDLPDEVEPVNSSAMARTLGSDAGPLPFKERVRRETQNVERDLIRKAFEEEGGNVTRTAEKLGLSRKGLQLKMKELGIRRGEAL